MSTSRRQVFIEFPNFGFGPAATTLTLLRYAPQDLQWNVVSTGAAAKFVHSQLALSVLHDLDTFDPAQWPRFADIAPSGSLVISNTNLEFAGWAAAHGYEVGIVDTLDWMWASKPPGVDLARFHLVQAFFAAAESRVMSARREIVSPIVDHDLWQSRPKDPTLSVIGFGGMTVPGQDSLIADHVRWLLGQLLPALLEVSERVVVVGGRRDLPGLLPTSHLGNARVQVRVAASRQVYAELCTRAGHLVLAPGLTSIYECAAAGLAPLFQPGFSMSMVLQAHRLTAAGYAHVAAWPWLAALQPRLATLSEAEGVATVAAHMRETIDSDTSHVEDAIRRYLEEPTMGGSLPILEHFPHAGARLAEHLRRWRQAPA